MRMIIWITEVSEIPDEDHTASKLVSIIFVFAKAGNLQDAQTFIQKEHSAHKNKSSMLCMQISFI